MVSSFVECQNYAGCADRPIETARQGSNMDVDRRSIKLWLSWVKLILLAGRKRSGMVEECLGLLSVAITSGWPVPDVWAVKQRGEGVTLVVP